MYIVNDYIIIDISLDNKCEKVINKQALGFYLTSEPNTVIDITSCFDQKLAAMALHSSQFSGETLALYRLYFMEKGRLQLMPQFHRECEKKRLSKSNPLPSRKSVSPPKSIVSTWC
ncbi:hypothetical protein [Paenibacillus sonchi]|uniref:hypothetical protein n=1 Tax=Paenibacillus sonchi TaxID=373687 RepID=UPI001E47DD61|nr:hypothetical protein [Paenibacillus sonchi]MCE3201775.1 hypothetical protein [Paenibacillus sonchi]